MLGWMDDEALHRTLTTGRGTYWSPQPPGVLGQGRHLRPRPARQVRRARLRRRHRAGQGRPGRRRLPHRRPHLLRRRRPPADGAIRCRRRISKVSRHGPRDLPQAGRPTAASSPSPAGSSPTATPRSPSTASSPPSAPAPSCWSPRRTAAPGPATPSSGVRSAATLTERDGQAHWLGTPPVGVPVDGDPLGALRATIEALHTPRDLHAAGPAALHRRHGRLPRLRRRAPPGEDRRPGGATTCSCPS